VLGASYDGREDGTRRIVPGESGLAHTGAVVNNESLDIIVTHDLFGLMLIEERERES
jgi:hypothetical protein